jgi:hypothetical protein
MTRSKRRWLVMAAAFVALAIVVVWLWRGKGEAGAVRRMPPDERAQLFQETYAATRTVCEAARTDDALDERCASWADFLLDFPECDEACRAFAKPYAPHTAAR